MRCVCWIVSRNKPVVVLTSLLLSGCVAQGWTHRGAATDITGNYRRLGTGSALLEVAPSGKRFQVTLTGGGFPGRHEAVPADCMVKAVGTLQGQLFSGRFEALSTADFSYSRIQAAAERRRLVITFFPRRATVERADTFGYCGLGINFLGKYRRVN